MRFEDLHVTQVVWVYDPAAWGVWRGVVAAKNGNGRPRVWVRTEAGVPLEAKPEECWGSREQAVMEARAEIVRRKAEARGKIESLKRFIASLDVADADLACRLVSNADEAGAGAEVGGEG